MGPRVSMMRARAALGVWKPRARRMIRCTALLSPSARALLMPVRIAVSVPSRNVWMVLAVLMNAGRRERVALLIHRSIRAVTVAVSRSPAKMARNASFNV